MPVLSASTMTLKVLALRKDRVQGSKTLHTNAESRQVQGL